MTVGTEVSHRLYIESVIGGLVTKGSRWLSQNVSLARKDIRSKSVL